MYRALLIFCFLLVVAATADEAADRFRRKDREISYGDTTREQVLETRNRRKRQLSNMILDARQKLADHAAGEITLTSDRKKALEDQMDIFQRKLDTMKEELEEWEIPFPFEKHYIIEQTILAHQLFQCLHSKEYISKCLAVYSIC